jgi:hypothetical protein
MLENQMRMSDAYWRAYERWKKIESIEGLDAAGRLSREQAHERPCAGKPEEFDLNLASPAQ